MEYKGYKITVERVPDRELERIGGGPHTAAFRAIAKPIKSKVAHLGNSKYQNCSCLDSNYLRALATAGSRGDASNASGAEREAKRRIKAGIDTHLSHRSS